MDLDLRSVNYGLPIGERSFKIAKPFGRSGFEYKYDVKYEFIELGNKRVETERGDIVRFGNKFSEALKNQLAVVIDRCRVIKYKVCDTYKDTETILMILTGSKKGEIYKVTTMRQSGLTRYEFNTP